MTVSDKKYLIKLLLSEKEEKSRALSYARGAYREDVTKELDRIDAIIKDINTRNG